MITKIDLCAIALLKIGESPIQSLDDNTAACGLARTLFDPVVNTLLASHPWRFATKKFNLTKTSDDNFLIPANVLRVLKCNGEIVGNRINARGETISINAIVKTAPENFPSYFVSLCATKLAMEFCVPLSGDQNVFRMLAALYESELQSAKFIDSASAINADIADFSLISARF